MAPTGEYSRDRIVNLGSNAWSISPYLALTWRFADRWEISSRTNFTWTSRSLAPPYATGLHDWQAGQQLAINLSTSYEIAANWRLGVGGYVLQQLTDSKTNGQRVVEARQGVGALGPGVSWSSGSTTLIINAYKEFGAVNRPEGYQGVLRFLTVF